MDLWRVLKNFKGIMNKQIDDENGNGNDDKSRERGTFLISSSWYAIKSLIKKLPFPILPWLSPVWSRLFLGPVLT